MKPVETTEQVGGVVLLEDTRKRWTGQQCEVVAVGEEEICEDEDCERAHFPSLVHPGPGFHPCHVKTGDWLLVRPRCYTATDVPDRWVMRQTDALAIIHP